MPMRRAPVCLFLTMLLATSCWQCEAKRKMGKKGARRASGASLTPRIDSIKAQLQDGQLPLDDGLAKLVALDGEAKRPADVAALNGVVGELYRHMARQQPGAVRRRTEHSAVGRFLRASKAWEQDDTRAIDSLRMAADTARDLSGGCAAELLFALEVQAQYAMALGAQSEEGQVAWAQLAEYQYFRQDFEGVLRSLSAIEEAAAGSGGLSGELEAMSMSLSGSALKQLERYEEAIDRLQRTLTLLSSEQQVDRKRQTTIHLGEALQRMGRREEADILWAEGVAAGWFPSAEQRPGQVYPRPLPSRPVWDVRDPSNNAGELRGIVEKLEATEVWSAIRAESRTAIAAGRFTVDPGSITRYNGGPWYHLVLYEYGLKDFKNCRHVPQTCAAVESLAKGAVAQNTQGQVKLSLMSPGIHVLPHCGAENATF
jgi:tetratricopeptide (TPR) repeat protein